MPSRTNPDRKGLDFRKTASSRLQGRFVGDTRFQGRNCRRRLGESHFRGQVGRRLRIQEVKITKDRDRVYATSFRGLAACSQDGLEVCRPDWRLLREQQQAGDDGVPGTSRKPANKASRECRRVDRGRARGPIEAMVGSQQGGDSFSSNRTTDHTGGCGLEVDPLHRNLTCSRSACAADWVVFRRTGV